MEAVILMGRPGVWEQTTFPARERSQEQGQELPGLSTAVSSLCVRGPIRTKDPL